jgi:hypothetical protein
MASQKSGDRHWQGESKERTHQRVERSTLDDGHSSVAQRGGATPSDPAGVGGRAASEAAQSEASDDLGQEGIESNIKRNTTGQGQRKDRGP